MDEPRQAETTETAEPEEVSLEELFSQLEELLQAMDDREVSLEDSFALYEKGMQMVRRCYDKLDQVETKMKQIAADGSEVLFEE